jgi:hypothetical protein
VSNAFTVVQKIALTAIVDQAHNFKREATPARTRAAKPPFGDTLSDRFYTPTLIRPDNDGDRVMSHSN